MAKKYEDLTPIVTEGVIGKSHYKATMHPPDVEIEEWDRRWKKTCEIATIIAYQLEGVKC